MNAFKSGSVAMALSVGLLLQSGMVGAMAETSHQTYTGHVQKQPPKDLETKAKDLGHKVATGVKADAKKPGVRRTATGAAVGAGVGVVTAAGVLPAAATGAAIGAGYHYAKKHHVGQKMKTALHRATAH